MNKILYKLKDTVDIFLSEDKKKDYIIVTFNIMTTRERIKIKANKRVALFIANIDGEKTIDEIIKIVGNTSKESAYKLIEFLLNHHLIVPITDSSNSNLRFSRQIAFWDDFVLDRPGEETQTILENKKIILFGCGAVGSKIIEILARAGVKNIVLFDYKLLSISNSARHCYYDNKKINNKKVKVLSEFLLKINKNININTHHEKLIPNTDLSKIIDEDVDLIINTCDEPYIGHTSLKLGRYAHSKNIPLYIAGGFDAHLMSSGELISPPFTPCIDCIQNTFSNALQGWKPIYSQLPTPHQHNIPKNHDNNKYIIGGPGGLEAMSNFSANFSCIKLLHFLLNDSAFEYNNYRYEYLINSGQLTKVELLKQQGCDTCNG